MINDGSDGQLEGPVTFYHHTLTAMSFNITAIFNFHTNQKTTKLPSSIVQQSFQELRFYVARFHCVLARNLTMKLSACGVFCCRTRFWVIVSTMPLGVCMRCDKCIL